MSAALLVVGGLFLFVYGTLALLAWRRPLIARFAWRESTRRPGQFALLVVGLMIATASIAASMVAAETVTATGLNVLNQRLGAVDLTVTAPGGRSFPSEVARQLTSDAALNPYVDGVQAGLEIPTSVTDLDQHLAKAGVFLAGFDPASQHRFGVYVLADGRTTDGTDLGPDDVLLSAALASALEARPGDRLRLSAGYAGGSLDARVYGVARARGPGAYGSNLAVYAPLAIAQKAAGDGGINLVRVAARGGTVTDLEPARRAAAPVAAALKRISSDAPLTVNQVRIEAAQKLQAGSAFILGTTLGISMLSVLAATALIVNLIVALAEERRPRLAVMRALGLSRGGLIGMSVLEGAIYSLAGATLGVAIGALLGLLLARQLWDVAMLDPTIASALGFSIQPTVHPATLAIAFGVGALITLGTVAVAAFRTSRLAIATAIRDLPEIASAAPNSRVRTALVLVLAAAGVALLVPTDPRARLVGGVAVIVAAAALTRGLLPDRVRVTLAGLLIAAWAVISASSTPYGSDLGKFWMALFLAVLTTAVSLSVAAAANLSLIGAAAGTPGNRFGRLEPTLRPPLAYLSRRPVRTGLTTGTFALVLVVVTLIAVFVAPVDPQYARYSAGFDIQVVATGSDPLQLPSDVERQVMAQIVLPMRVYQGPIEHSIFGSAGASPMVVFYDLPEQARDLGPLYLSDKDKRFASDSDVWRAVLAEPGLVIGDWGSGLTVGEDITLAGVNGQLRLRIAANSGSTILDGIVASPATIAQIPTRPAGSTTLLKLRPGSDVRDVTLRIARGLYTQGVEASSTRDIIDQDRLSGEGYFIEYDTLLHLALLVGALALAMVMARVVVERRRAIGILRALGYQPARVAAGLVIEASIAATIGTLTGVLSGLVIGYLGAHRLDPPSQFGVDLARIAVALAIVYGTVLIVTGPLALRAARIVPADAIRMTG